ncbi:MAG: nucleoside triphosphate pyrophosphohydrolase [Spirochaetia bacterium]
MKDIPLSEDAIKAGESFARLYQTILELRGPTGCPWDKAQSMQTLHPHLIEESYELLEGIKNQDTENICEEIGDVYLVNTMIASIMAEESAHSTKKILDQLNEKLIRRHPHVFGEGKVQTAEEGRESWIKAKMAEKKNLDIATHGALYRCGRGLPPLEQAAKIQNKISKLGFSWPNAITALNKVKEEIQELEVEIAGGDIKQQSHEIGDVFFSLIGLSASLGIIASEAIYATSQKIVHRVHYIENILRASGLELDEKHRDKMEDLWQESKKNPLCK